MRLTLRTLLSYLDQVHLTKEEREAIQRQILASDNAAEWIHRTQDVTRRLRVGVPEIDGSGSADDPNSVAEYLDRTLPDESVAEFERVCLESEPLLAEVASCHHVLAMFLSGDAEIDPDTRNRLHRLQADLTVATRARIEQAAGSVASPEPTDDRVAEPVQTPPPRKKVPGYLRESGSPVSLKQWAPAIAALILLAVTAGVAFLPGGPLNPEDPELIVEADSEAAASKDPDLVAPLTEPLEEAASDAESAPDEGADDPSLPDGKDANNEVQDGTAGPGVVLNGEPASGAPIPPTQEGSEQGPAPSADGVGEEATDPVEAMTESTDPVNEASEPAAPAEPASPVYQSGSMSLGLYEFQRDSWRRLEQGFKIAGPTRVVSLPTYRNTFGFGPDLTVEIVGLTDLTIVPPADPDGVLALDLNHGRLLLTHAVGASTPALVELVLDGTPHRLACDPGAVVAIRADRLFRAGWPVEESSPPVVAIADTLAGAVEWTTGGRTERVRRPDGKAFGGELTESLAESLGDNAWVEALPLSEVDRDTAVAIAAAIQVNKPIWPQLREIASGDRFVERRSLAALSSASLGHPDSLIESFKDGKQSAQWARNFAWLRQTASHDTSWAKKIRQGFQENVSSEAAEGLMDLLVGFPPQDVGSDLAGMKLGSLATAVFPALESSDVATRVLGSLVLNELVTGAEGEFNPLSVDRRRTSKLRMLRNRLDDGKLTPRGP